MLAWQVARDIHVEHRMKDCGPRTQDSQDQGARTGLRNDDWQLGIKDSGRNQALDEQELA